MNLRKEKAIITKRIQKLPLDLQLIFYEDIYEAMANRLKVLEKEAN